MGATKDCIESRLHIILEKGEQATMKIRSFLLAFFALMLGLVFTDFTISYQLEILQTKVQKAEEQRQILLSLADELRMSSEFLTRFARRYVVTRDDRVLKYYQNILYIRDGKIARPTNYNDMYWDLVAAGAIPEPESTNVSSPTLMDRFVLAGLTASELEKLNESKSASDKLARLELLAIHAAIGEFDDGTETYTIKKKPDERFAIKLLNDKNYMEAKALVVKPLGEVLDAIRARVDTEVATLTNKSADLVRINAITALALVLMLCAAVGYTFYRIGLRSAALLDVVKKIANRDFTAKANMKGNDEIAELAIAVNTMGSDLMMAFEALNDKVSLAEKAAIDLEEERQRSEKLLYNILPAVIADRLRSGEKTIAETYQEVTVMFADIVGFTQLSSELGPYKTVHMLNDIFGRFDNLIKNYEIEKIKTIGDCYMVVAGVPTRNPLHCQQIAQFAIDAMRSIEEYSKNIPFDLKIRIGLHTGTVAAGIIGESRFSYDLWGEVVNLASRYEGASAPNKIHVSEAVKTRLSDDFVFEDNGLIDLKSFGTVHSWFLIGSKRTADVIELKTSKSISF